MKTIIHVNQFNIRRNRKEKWRAPVISAKDYKQNRYGNTVVITKDGTEIARVVYRPDKPLKCGAVCWVETKNNVLVF